MPLPFTAVARQIQQLMHQEALRFSHEEIEPEHLLIAVVKLGIDELGDLFTLLGVSNLRDLRLAVERRMRGRSELVLGQQIPLSRRVKVVLAFANEEAHWLGDTEISSIHLLLGLLRMELGPIAEAFAELDLSIAGAREAVQQIQQCHPAKPPPTATARIGSRRRYLSCLRQREIGCVRMTKGRLPQSAYCKR